MMPDGGDVRPMMTDRRPWPVPRWRDKWRILIREADQLSMSTLPDRLAELYGDRPALFVDRPLSYSFFEGDCVTYRDLARFVARIAHALRRLGVRKGDRVGLMTGNRIEAAFAEFAAQRLGAVPVPLNIMLRAGEVEYLARDCGFSVFITDRPVYDGIAAARDRLGLQHWIVISQREPPPGTLGLRELIADEPDSDPASPLAPDDLAIIFYTAGTTGFPKGAMLSDAALMFALRAYGKIIAFLPTGRRNLSLLVMPLAHTSGHQALLLQLLMGMPMLLMGRFDPQKVLQTIQDMKVTMFTGIPAMYRMLLDAGARQYDLTSIEMWGGGGDAFPDELLHTFRDLAARRGRFGRRRRPRFVRGYGLAETAGQLATAMGPPVGDGAAGKVVRGVQYKIVGDDGQPVPTGAVGELLVKSPAVMAGYWNNPEATAAVLQDGWFRTGDLVREGRGRMLYMQAREKDMIKVGGYSVFPAEIERKLAEHPAVADVAVVGIPHATKGELPVAAVVTAPGAVATASDLVAWGKEHMAPYKAPRQVVFVDAIPQNFAMKAKRREVREVVMQLLEQERLHPDPRRSPEMATEEGTVPAFEWKRTGRE